MTKRLSVNLDNLTFLERAQDFMDLYDFPQDLVRAAIRHHQRIEPDPSSADKGYPVVRLTRGDITVVLGLRDPEHPAVIHVWLHMPPDFGSTGSAGSVKPGAGRSGSKGPVTTTQLRKWLGEVGCTLEPGSKHITVRYKGRFIGNISSTPGDYRTVTNEYHSLKRGMAAVTADLVREQAATDVARTGVPTPA